MSKKKYDKGQRREREPKEFEEEVLEIARVTRVVKGGRRLRFRALVAIGDKKGRVAIGIGKATEVVNAIKKAVSRAKKSLVNVPITDVDSIPHEVRLKHKAARIHIMPASSGTGVIAGGSLRKILGLAGVKNVLSKNHGTNNKVVTAQAAILALQLLRPVRKSAKSPQSGTPSAGKKADEAKVKSDSAEATSEPAKDKTAEKSQEESKKSAKVKEVKVTSKKTSKESESK